ncbi:LysR family transcriptional regulator [Roseovarius sp. CAU 1744]|uniref:LysR family transcriptional regulator n=1 Tax=Roseovarius sp. CAU 1744 TaxID=3140368 RepID=UPI00325A9F25
MQFDLRSLQCFIALAEIRSFSRAAEVVHLAQPTFSQRIARLEDLLGFALFERHSSETSLTRAGAQFLPHAQALLRQCDDLAVMAARIREGGEGLLRIGYTSVSFFSFVPLLIQAFETRHPGVRLELTEYLSDGIEVELEAGRLDLGFLHPPLRRAAKPHVDLPGERYFAALPKDHPLIAQESIDPSTLAGESLIVTKRSTGPAIFDRLVHMVRQTGVEPQIAHEVSNSAAVIGLVAAGRGVGFVIEPMADLSRPGVCFRPLEGQDVPVLPFALCWKAREPHPARDVFIDFAKTYCQGISADDFGDPER